MSIKSAFGKALRALRDSTGTTQEDFSEVSSRTYVSSLERGIRGPTIEKVDELAKVIGVHPLTLLFATYVIKDHEKAKALLAQVADELDTHFKEGV